MQQLQLELKNVPGNAPQVPCSTSHELNREETLGVHSSVLDCNNPEVDLHQHHTGGLKAVVYVLSIEGRPLMPCTPTKARKLLKSKKAIVVKLYPFTIKLNFECENQIQNITLGIDTGYGNIGFSAITLKRELISGVLILDSKTSKRLTEKRLYRKIRRSKLWYRKRRLLNRRRSIGWLPPSIQRRYNTHLVLIKRIKVVLPISQVIIEVANFDIQKIKNPEILNIGYQQGVLYDYQNIRSYLISRERGLCQLCGKEFLKGDTSRIHHCKQKSELGSNSVDNLALLHEKCHKKIHKSGLKLASPQSFKQNTFMCIIHKRFWLDIPELKVTYGYATFLKRQELHISKSHNNDAFIIAGGSDQERNLLSIIQQKHRNNRVLQINRIGFKPSIRKQRYPIQPLDIIWIKNKRHISNGMQNKDKYVGLKNCKKVIPIIKISKYYNFGGVAWAI